MWPHPDLFRNFCAQRIATLWLKTGKSIRCEWNRAQFAVSMENMPKSFIMALSMAFVRHGVWSALKIVAAFISVIFHSNLHKNACSFGSTAVFQLKRNLQFKFFHNFYAFSINRLVFYEKKIKFSPYFNKFSPNFNEFPPHNSISAHKFPRNVSKMLEKVCKRYAPQARNHRRSNTDSILQWNLFEFAYARGFHHDGLLCVPTSYAILQLHSSKLWRSMLLFVEMCSSGWN